MHFSQDYYFAVVMVDFSPQIKRFFVKFVFFLDFLRFVKDFYKYIPIFKKKDKKNA